MPLGTRPPDLSVLAGELTLREVAELNAIATEAVLNGENPDCRVCEVMNGEPEKDDD